jgi:antirestriction protein ArdC
MKMKMAGIGGLYAKVQFNLQSEKGREAFANVAFFGEEQEWSIGYKTLRAQYDENLQANVLYEVELYEVSPVLHGANQLTGTISVKSDEEKMHGMMPMSISAPSSEPRRDGLFDEGVSQRISGPQLAGVVAELSRRAAGPVMVVEATENSVVFVKPGKGKFRIGYHFTGSEYMFGKPELIHAEQAKPPVQSGPSPMPGIMGKPNKPSTNNPAMAMPVAMKPVNGGMVMVPLAPVEYEGSDKNKKPELGAEESELAESLVRIARKYGKFDEDGDGIWAGYYPPAENKVKDIGVKCSNCVLYQGEGKCKILDFKVEDDAKCRFAIIPDGVVVGYGKKQYSDILDDEEIKMIEDIEAKYPGEFILGTFRNLVKKRRKKRKSYKTLEEWGVEESELEEKGLDPFLANEYSYVIPVNLEDAFEFKSVIDPVLDYHRIDTTVNEYGIVINSPLSEESKDAITRAASSAYKVLKKKITSEQIEEKALGRRIGRAIASRGIDRPNLGGKRGRRSRGSGINPPPGWDPRTVEDANLNSMVGDGTPWEQPDPTPSGPGSINSPKPSKRQMRQRADLADTEKLSSGKRNERRHADRSADMEKQFPNAEENQKRVDHEAIAKAWEDQGLGWEEVPRYNADKNFSSDYLRGREIGVNQARVMWNGDSVRKRPEKFNEKQKASNEYSNWYSSYAKSVSAYLDAHSRDDSDNWDGIESALRADVKSKYPDTQDWAKEDIATLNEYLNDIGLLDVDKLKRKKKKKKAGTETEKGPDLQELRRLNSEGKLSSGDKKKPAPKKDKESLSSGEKLTNREIEKQEMDAADNSLRSFIDGFDGWDDEEWEFGNQLDGAVERWASANEDMPFINTSVEEMIDEMDADESIEGQNKLAFLKNLQQSIFDAQDRARMSDDERSRDRLERSVRRSQSDFDEGGRLSSGRGPYSSRGEYDPDLDPYFDEGPEPDYEQTHEDEWDNIPSEVRDEIINDIKEYVTNRDESAADNVARQMDDENQLSISDNSIILEQDGLEYVATPVTDKKELFKQLVESGERRGEYTSRPSVAKEKLLESLDEWADTTDRARDGGALTGEEADLINEEIAKIKSIIENPSDDPMVDLEVSKKKINGILKTAYKRTSDGRVGDNDMDASRRWGMLNDVDSGNGFGELRSLKDTYRQNIWKGQVSKDGKYEITEIEEFAKDAINGGELEYEVDGNDTYVSKPAYTWYDDFAKFSSGAASSGADDDGAKDEAQYRDTYRELLGFLDETTSSEDEAQRVLDNWYDNDSRQDEYLAEYREDGDSFSANFARAASAMYQDHLERLYDNRQERNLSSGRRTPEQEARISDREVFERRMSGESLTETAKALGMKREEVRQAEMRHMARERGTLQKPDFDDIEAYREDQARMAAEEAAELALNESIYLRRMGGESLAETAEALGMSREDVRASEQKHMQLMRSMDREAKRWVEKQSGDMLGSGGKEYVSPLEGMETGQRLSSGKMDEVYRSVQEQLIQQIQKAETEGGKWEFPWHRDASLPRNAMNNNRPYSGINSLMLMFRKDAMGYETGLWAGFNQWKDKGGTVRKGEKGTLIIIPTVIPPKKDADGNEIKSGSIFFKTGYVFNLDQIDGIDKEQFKMPQLSEEERVAELEQALSEVGAVVNHGGDRAFYRPSTDEITLPPFASFKSKEAYYAVFAHELMHWTGHKDRLNRDHLGDFGSPEYAQEELVAEIASAFFMTAHGLTPEPREDHAQYLASWLKKLKSDPDALKKAFEEAQKAHDFAIAQSPSMSKKLGRKVAEAGVIPGNNDAGYGGSGPSLSSGRREKYVLNPEGTVRTLADEMGAFGDEVLTEFSMRRGYRDGDRNWFEAQAFLGGRSRPSQWNISQDESGEWFAELMVMDGVDDNDEIDWDIAGVGSEGFKSPEDAARWADSYASSRREWQSKFREETDIEKIAEMLNEEEARRDAEYENYKRASRERADRQEYVRMMAQIDESRLNWSPEDWADEASDIQAELMRENSRLSSGVRSRYDDKPVEEIGLVTDALQRTDEAGSNSRHIASRLLAVPVDKYDFDSIRRNGEVISFTYNGKPRMVYPTGMMTKKGGGIYFIGLDEESGQYRSFSLHKIEGLIDGAIAPINPTQPGVPQGTSFASGRRTRNITSGRLSSGRVRPLDEVRAEIEDDARYESMVVQDAFNGRLGTEKKGEFRVTIPLEDHAEAVQSLDRLVVLRNDLLRSLLDGKRMPAGSYIFEVDKYAPVAEDELDLLMNIDDAVDRIHDELRRREEQFSELNDEIDDMKDSISELEDAFRTTTRMGARNIPGPVNFESAMERNIDMADGDDEYAIRLIESDADPIIEALEKIDDTEDRFGATHGEQIAEIKELIDSANRGDLTPQEFASKLGDLYYKNVNGLEEELSDLFNIQTQFEDNGVTPNREDITGTPEDVFSPKNLSNFDMAEGNASDFLEAGDAPGLSSGRTSRTQGSKRRPMSDADRQAFADGVRQRAATIPGKKKPGPSKDEFGTEKFSSGKLVFPSRGRRNAIGRELAADVKIKFGKMSENNDRSPDGKWLLDARKLQQFLVDDGGEPLSSEEIASYLGIKESEVEQIFKAGTGISEADAYALIDRAFFDSSNPFETSAIIDGVWGFNAKPYWYDKDGNQLTREQYDDFLDEGIWLTGLLSPIDMEETEEVVGTEIRKGGFQLSTLAKSLGVSSDEDLAKAITFEVDGVQIVPTAAQLKKWEQDGIPTGIIEQLVDRGVIPSAGSVFGEEGVTFDNSIRQFDLWKNVRDAIEKSGTKAKYKDLDEVIGATKVLRRLKDMEEGKEGKFSPRVGKALRYSESEVQEIVDRLNKKYNLNETVESIKGGGSMSSGRRAARRISNTGQEAVEKLASGRKNNGAPENITPRMQKEIMGWAENATWSNFAQSLVSQFKEKGFLSPTQWTSLLRLHDNSKRRR